jgi:hypothetical protein
MWNKNAYPALVVELGASILASEVGISNTPVQPTRLHEIKAWAEECSEKELHDTLSMAVSAAKYISKKSNIKLQIAGV